MFTPIVGADRCPDRASNPGKTLETLYKLSDKVERAKGFEPSTPTLASLSCLFAGVRRCPQGLFLPNTWLDIGPCLSADIRRQSLQNGTPRGPRMALTDTRLRAVKATGRRREYPDRGGLVLRVTAKGATTWTVS
jgi:hypothetical protein